MDYPLEEKKLFESLSTLLSRDFEIIPEEQISKSPGKFLLDGHEYNSIPDLILRPKPELIQQGKFIDTIIPVEIKKFSRLETNKFEDLMFQCHSYRLSNFQGVHPKLCLYFINNYFEYRKENEHLRYNYEESKKPGSIHHTTYRYIKDKIQIETLFGRFGIGELVTNGDDYWFRVKRQVLFQSKNQQLTFNSNVLNFWLGTKGVRRNHSK